MLEFSISSSEDNQTIISFLKKRFKTTPLSLIYKLFRVKKIKLNKNHIRYYHHRLKTGDKIIIHDQSLKIAAVPVFQAPPQSFFPLKSVHEDENILIVIKEHNVPMRDSGDCLDKAVNHYLYQQNPSHYQKNLQTYFVYTAVHRLDKLTKGLVIYPKNSLAKKALYNAIKDKSVITKSYLAVCENYHSTNFPSSVEGFISKNELKQRMEFSFQAIRDNSQSCSLQTQTLFRWGDYQLLKMILGTGRKHQIRAISSYYHNPVVGDEKYGSKVKLDHKILLFAYQLEFNKLPPFLAYLNQKSFCLKNLQNDLIKWIKKQ